MNYVIEPSTFGIGYSIFRLEVKDGKRVKTYLADALSVREAKQLCPGAAVIYCPAEDAGVSPTSMDMRSAVAE